MRRRYHAGDNYIWRIGAGRLAWFEAHSAIPQVRHARAAAAAARQAERLMVNITAFAFGFFLFIALHVSP
jgi:hypothetical protein